MEKVAIWKREIVTNSALCVLIGITGAMLATAAGAYIRIPLPFTPVPITLQTFFVLLTGAVLGARVGSFSQLGYVALGIAGLPLFCSPTHPLYIFGPTGGYLVGFVVAAWVVGKIVRRHEKASFLWIVLAMITGSLIIYLLGASWLAYVLHCGIKKALFLGVLPFIPGDIIKVLAAATIFERIEKRAREIYP